jgi:hypothetical protein
LSLDIARDCYLGTVKLRDFDETYAMDEWFDDSGSNGGSRIYRASAQRCWNCSQQAGRTWKSPELWAAYKKATRTSRGSLLGRLLRG